MVFLSLVVFGFSTKPLTMIRLFAELSGHYLNAEERFSSPQHRQLENRRSAMIVGMQKLRGGLEDDRGTLWLDGRRLPACGHEKRRADEGPPEERSVRV
jgi:hypothetical protein